MSRIGVLAVQGNFREHSITLHKLGVSAHLVRTIEDLSQVDALIFPGGESTAMTRILRTAQLISPIMERIKQGMPCYGSCAGLILLSTRLSPADARVHTFAAIDITVERNAFGRQQESFETVLSFQGIVQPIEAVFIRAPLISEIGPTVQIVSQIENSQGVSQIVAARERNCLVTAFHPEMTADLRVHQYFLDLVG